MNDTRTKVLVIGYGNPGRIDDGLGPAFVKALEQLNLPGISTISDYQLNVEHAAELAGCDVVIFADADTAAEAPFRFDRIHPETDTTSFTTHHVSPQAVLGMALEMFDAMPKAYVLGIRGYEFDDFEEKLSDKAADNLQAALAFFADSVKDGAFQPRGTDYCHVGEKSSSAGSSK